MRPSTWRRIEAKRETATLGAYDFVQVFEMPDNEAMLQYVPTARRDGFVEPLIPAGIRSADLRRDCRARSEIISVQLTARTSAVTREAIASGRGASRRANELRNSAIVSRAANAISRGLSTPTIMNSWIPKPA